MNDKNENASDSVAAIGIGAMIVFIALILVAAVASAVIIQTGEKLQQNAQQTGQDTQSEIGGKISIITAWIDTIDGGPSSTIITLVWETAPGSEDMIESDIVWSINCDEDGDGTSLEDDNGDFGATHDLTDTTIGNDATSVDVISSGTTYMIDIPTVNCNGDPGEQHPMFIEVKNGGSTYELLQFQNIAVGAVVV